MPHTSPGWGGGGGFNWQVHNTYLWWVRQLKLIEIAWNSLRGLSLETRRHWVFRWILLRLQAKNLSLNVRCILSRELAIMLSLSYMWANRLITRWLRIFAVVTKTFAKSDIINFPHWTCLHHLNTLLIQLTKLLTTAFATDLGDAFCQGFSAFVFVVRPSGPSTALPFLFTFSNYLFSISIIIPQFTQHRCLLLKHSICIPRLQWFWWINA